MITGQSLDQPQTKVSTTLGRTLQSHDDPSDEGCRQSPSERVHQQWKQAKMLVGATMYVDVLKAPSLLSLCLQDEKLDIVSGIRHLLKSCSKHFKAIAVQNPPAE